MALSKNKPRHAVRVQKINILPKFHPNMPIFGPNSFRKTANLGDLVCASHPIKRLSKREPLRFARRLIRLLRWLGCLPASLIFYMKNTDPEIHHGAPPHGFAGEFSNNPLFPALEIYLCPPQGCHFTFLGRGGSMPWSQNAWTPESMEP